MRLMKVFQTREMTPELFEAFRDSGSFVLDAWFVAHGALVGEQVLVEHGQGGG